VGGVLAEVGEAAADVVWDAAKEAGGTALGLAIVNPLHAVEAIADVARAGKDEITGHGDAAHHDLQNAVADGFQALPFHELAWDGLAGLGQAVDGPNNQMHLWESGGAEQFREGVGADPEGEGHIPLPGEPENTEA
jgi:hypothetical protein